MKNKRKKLNPSQLKLIDGIAFSQSKFQISDIEKKSEILFEKHI